MSQSKKSKSSKLKSLQSNQNSKKSFYYYVLKSGSGEKFVVEKIKNRGPLEFMRSHDSILSKWAKDDPKSFANYNMKFKKAIKVFRNGEKKLHHNNVLHNVKNRARIIAANKDRLKHRKNI